MYKYKDEIKRILKKTLKKIFIYLNFLIPYPADDKTIYVTGASFNNKEGPERFLFNFKNALNEYNIKLEPTLLAKCRYAFIIINSPGDLFFHLCKVKNIKTIFRVDGFYMPTIFDNKNYKYRMKRELALNKINMNQRLQRDIFFSDHVIYQSKFCKLMIDKYLYNRTHNFSIIYNFVNTDLFRPLYDMRDSYFSILCVGNWRDTDVMFCNLETLRLLRKHIDARLYIIGNKTKEVDIYINSYIEKHKKLKPFIKVQSFIEMKNLPNEINKCHMALHLKSGDWCPNAVLESMSCGLPVICHKWGGTKELIGEKNHKLIINTPPLEYTPDYAKKVVNAIIEIYPDLKLYSKIMRNRVTKYFSQVKIMEQYIRLFER